MVSRPSRPSFPDTAIGTAYKVSSKDTKRFSLAASHTSRPLAASRNSPNRQTETTIRRVARLPIRPLGPNTTFRPTRQTGLNDPKKIPLPLLRRTRPHTAIGLPSRDGRHKGSAIALRLPRPPCPEIASSVPTQILRHVTKLVTCFPSHTVGPDTLSLKPIRPLGLNARRRTGPRERPRLPDATSRLGNKALPTDT